MPHGGWPAPPEYNQKFLDMLKQPRRDLLVTRGLLSLKLRVPPPPKGATIHWVFLPTGGLEAAPSSATWYIDGSLYDEGYWFSKRLGFGIVVVDADGTLLAMAHGISPSWIKDAAGAEVWAFYVALQLSPTPPRIVTDCKNITETLLAGVHVACEAKCPLARTWRMVAHILEDSGDTAAACKQTIWMPSHGSLASVGTVLKSNCTPVSTLDWRANRLVDALAKKAAAEFRLPAEIRHLLGNAEDTLERALAQLGFVTHCANNLKVCDNREDGTPFWRVARDSTGQKPTATHVGKCKKRSFEVMQCPALADQQGLMVPIDTSASDLGAYFATVNRRVKARHAQRDHVIRNEILFQEHWRSNRQNLLLRPSVPGDASGRLVALRQRVRAREAHHRQPWE